MAARSRGASGPLALALVARLAEAHARTARRRAAHPRNRCLARAGSTSEWAESPSARRSRHRRASRAGVRGGTSRIPAAVKSGQNAPMLATASVRGVRGLARYALTSEAATPRPRKRGSTITREISLTLALRRRAVARPGPAKTRPKPSRLHQPLSVGMQTASTPASSRPTRARSTTTGGLGLPEQ